RYGPQKIVVRPPDAAGLIADRGSNRTRRSQSSMRSFEHPGFVNAAKTVATQSSLNGVFEWRLQMKAVLTTNAQLASPKSKPIPAISLHVFIGFDRSPQGVSRIERDCIRGKIKSS